MRTVVCLYQLRIAVELLIESEESKGSNDTTQ